jgi:hypothetical protein
MSTRALGTLSPIDTLLSQLLSGEEVVILKGEGFPPVLKETTAIVWQIYGSTVVTSDGITLKSSNLTDLIRTGRRFETFQTTHEAFQVVGKIVAELKEAETAAEKNVDPTKKYRGGDWETFEKEPE